jgi:hypothetical protein
MSVTAEHKRRGGSMTSRELRRLPRCDAPGVHHAQNSRRRPYRVGEVVQRKLETVALRLMPLRDRAGDPAEDFEPTIQIVMLRRGYRLQFRGNSLRDQAGVVTPRHDVVEENVAMRDKYPPVGEVEMVEIRKVSVVIAAEKRHHG